MADTASSGPLPLLSAGTPAAGRVARAFRQLVGPDATRAENIGTIGTALVGAAWSVRVARRAALSAPATALSAAFALDLVGGVWTNMTPSCKRWYHRPGQGPMSHLAFAAAHVHPHVVARTHPKGWRYGVAHHVYLLTATGVVLRTPRRLQPALATVLALGGIALDAHLGPPAGRAWMMPAYYLKLLPGHAVGPAGDVVGQGALQDLNALVQHEQGVGRRCGIDAGVERIGAEPRED